MLKFLVDCYHLIKHKKTTTMVTTALKMLKYMSNLITKTFSHDDLLLNQIKCLLITMWVMELPFKL